MMIRFYVKPFLSAAKNEELLKSLRENVPIISGLDTEQSIYINAGVLKKGDLEKLKWYCSSANRENLSTKPFCQNSDDNGVQILEFGPSMHFETSDSTNKLNSCRASGLDVDRIEHAKRFAISSERPLTYEENAKIFPLLHDKMTESFYPKPLKSFKTKKRQKGQQYIPLLQKGMKAMDEANTKYGGSLDEEDKKYMYYLFVDINGRNPTVGEFLDLCNSNSEHSRHHIFRSKIIIGDVVMPFNLMQIIKSTLKNLKNSVIAFHDNASAIYGFPVDVLIPEKPGFPSAVRMTKLLYHFVLTCETHNHPCLWAAYPGAATGGNGRRRDNELVGRGGIVVAASTGFLGGNLYLQNYPLDWEDKSFVYDQKVESGKSFFTKAPLGAFDDGNQFGEPVINGFAQSFGLRISEERWEYIKPVMFTGGYGFIDDRHKKKNGAKRGYIIVKLGGKAYRIGVGGGAASSMLSGTNKEDLDFNSVQRADGEQANKNDRVLRDCIDLGDDNPIEDGSDQGAGGNGNVIKEVINPEGGVIYFSRMPIGDKTMTGSEILVAEYQENHVLLIKPEKKELFAAICERNRAIYAFIGEITGDGKAVFYDTDDKTKVVDLELKRIFGDYPKKTYKDTRRKLDLTPFAAPAGLTVRRAMELVFRLMDVASKEWLVHNADRSVTGKVVQQQCVGPMQLPLSNYSLITPGPFSFTGQANSIGLRPSIGLISPQAMSRMASAEALLKLMFVPITNRTDIKLSANWMLAAKLPGGLAWLYDAAAALKKITDKLGMDIDGGKDSLSMAMIIKLLSGAIETVRSPGTLVISTYVGCPDYRLRLQPYIKRPGESKLMYVDLANGQTRMGGSALAYVLKQLGDECPDVEDAEKLNGAFDLFQKLLPDKLLLSAHKRSRGGLMATLSEMAFAGNCGLEASLSHPQSTDCEMLYNEELGAVFEYLPENESEIIGRFEDEDLQDMLRPIGKTTLKKRIKIAYNGSQIINEDMRVMRDVWRDTSFHLKKEKIVHACVDDERRNTYDRVEPSYKLTFDPDKIKAVNFEYPGKPKVAVLREEGSNSDHEMKVALYLAGFQPVDIHMTDIIEGRISLDKFRGLATVGGFSFKDVFGSGVGWAGVIKFNPRAYEQFYKFFMRRDTWSFHVCNGNQLITLLLKEFGLLPEGITEKAQPQLVRNRSEIFESRNESVRIIKSPALMLKDMEGSVLGIHNAHGEGRYYFPEESALEKILAMNLAPIRYVDDYGAPTEEYPFNPNGSPFGIAGYCDPSGRHLMMMPHPERTVLPYQWHYMPAWMERFKNSPWLRMFQNAREWCENN